jgi:hypothetical protein
MTKEGREESKGIFDVPHRRLEERPNTQPGLLRLLPFRETFRYVLIKWVVVDLAIVGSIGSVRSSDGSSTVRHDRASSRRSLEGV